MSPNREARLKPEFADVYPGLEAGVWQPAGRIAEYFLARPDELPSATTELTSRVLDERHFEFRGGPGTAGERPQQGRAGD
jgi:hypothetical protein